MPATYEPIATTTLGSAASSITFSSIPGTYTDLRLVLVGFDVSPRLRFNSDTGTNYSNTRLSGDGSAASSARSTSQSSIALEIAVGGVGTIPVFCNTDIFSYAGSTYKTVLCMSSNDRNGDTVYGNVVSARVGLWRSTSAITSIEITDQFSGNMSTGTTATLYGILKA